MQERREAHPLYTLGLPPAYPRKTAAVLAIPHTLSSGSPPRPNCFCWPSSLRSHSTSLQSLTGSGGGCVGLTAGYVGSCPVCPKSLSLFGQNGTAHLSASLRAVRHPASSPTQPFQTTAIRSGRFRSTDDKCAACLHSVKLQLTCS